MDSFARLLDPQSLRPLSRHDRFYSIIYLLAGPLLITLVALHSHKGHELGRKDTAAVGFGFISFFAGLLLILYYYALLGLRVWRILLAGVSTSGGGLGVAAVFWKGSLWGAAAFTLWWWCAATLFVARVDGFWAKQLPGTAGAVPGGAIELVDEDDEDEEELLHDS